MRRPAPSRARRLRSFGLLARAWLTAVILISAVLGTDALAAAPRFDEPLEAHSANGAVLLRWDSELDVGEREYELQEADASSFEQARVCYRGSFPSFFVSGRRDGARYFRVRSRSYEAGRPSAWSEWSATKVVVVEHHELGGALGLFGAGALVFIATCMTLVAGSRTSRKGRG